MSDCYFYCRADQRADPKTNPRSYTVQGMATGVDALESGRWFSPNGREF
jgi:hypothetical protein